MSSHEGFRKVFTAASIVVGVLAAASGRSATFSPQPAYPVDGEAQWGTACDLDGADGLDLVVPAAGSPTALSIFFNNGNGTYGPAQTVAIPGTTAPSHVVCCDLDQDGDLDLAVSDRDGGFVHVLENDASTFAPIASLGPLAGPRMAACCDLDGWVSVGNDLIVVEEDADRLSVFLQESGGGFGASTTIGVGPAPTSVVCAHLDSNRWLDLAVTDRGGDEVTVLLGPFSGAPPSPVSYPVGDEPTFLAACDLDGDAFLDLATANTGSDDVTVLLNKGDGSFTLGVDYATGGSSAYVGCGNVDCDRRNDLVVARPDRGDLYLLRNAGKGILVPGDVLPAGLDAATVDVAELNGAPPAELWVVGRGSSSFLSVLDNTTPAPSTCNCSALPEGIVAWYPADDCSAEDVIGANEGTLNGAMYCPSETRVGAGALGFDESPSTITVPYDPSLDFGLGGFTWTAWIKTSEQDTALLLKGVPAPGYYVHLLSGRLRLLGCDSFVCIGASGSNVPVADGAWHHVAITVRRLEETPNAQGQLSTRGSVHVDGREDARWTAPVGTLDSATSLEIGQGAGTPPPYYTGLMDEVTVFDRALSTRELFEMAEACRAGTCRGDVTLTVGRTSLSWSAWPGARSFDVVRGHLDTLRASAGDFSLATADCLGDDVAGSSLGTPTDPDPGEGLWYLVRSADDLRDNTYDSLGGAQVGSRDGGIASSIAHCP